MIIETIVLQSKFMKKNRREKHVEEKKVKTGNRKEKDQKII